jgi:hypothetical protein
MIKIQIRIETSNYSLLSSNRQSRHSVLYKIKKLSNGWINHSDIHA